MSITPQDIKKQFPIFSGTNKDLVYLDNASTTQKPETVIQAISDYYQTSNANVHRGIYDLSERSTAMYEEARQTVSDFINGENGVTVFTSGTTDSINQLADMFEETLEEGDYIITSEIEHHSNFLPWLELAKRKKLNLKVIPVSADRGITLDDFCEISSKIPDGKLKIVALTHISNVTGGISPITAIAEDIKRYHSQAKLIVDGAQAVGHRRVNVEKLQADAYVFSGHKMYGPMGIGVIWLRKDLAEKLQPVRFGGGMIESVSYDAATWANGVEKWEAGTPNVSGAVGIAEAIKFLSEIGMDEIEKYETNLTQHLVQGLSQVEGLTILGPKDSAIRSGVVSFYFENYHPHDVSQILSEQNIAVRAGHHCVQPFHKKLGINGTIRASLGVYNDTEDLNKLVRELNRVGEVLS